MVDPFFVNPSNRAKKRIRSNRSSISGSAKNKKDDLDEAILPSEMRDVNSDSASSDSEVETQADKRRRLAKEYLKNLQQDVKSGDSFKAEDLDREIISRRLKKDVGESQGVIFRTVDDASVSPTHATRISARQLVSIAAHGVHAYTLTKDGRIQKWYLSQEAPKLLRIVSMKFPTEKGRFKEPTCIAANEKYVVTGGKDHQIAVWSAENLTFIHNFDVKGREGAVLCMTFRKGTQQLYVGSADLRVRAFDLEPMTLTETLYGHQDEVVDISALTGDFCVSVGARDRSAIFWKVSEETRLTFRSSDIKPSKEITTSTETTLEGCFDCCSMIDRNVFVTGSDNGTITLWSTQRKKPLCVHPKGHGIDPPLPALRASGNVSTEHVKVPAPLPRPITAICALPFSDVFFTGSWSGAVHMWKLSDNKRGFKLLRKVDTGAGIVNQICVSQDAKKRNLFYVAASMAREPRLGRWIKQPGHNKIISFSLNVL